MNTSTIVRRAAALASLALTAAACGDETITFRDRPVSVRDTTATFNQIDRLGNPLISEALLEKRDHGFHNDGTPETDRINFTGRIVKFITTVARRDAAFANAVASIILPDMMVVQTDKAPTTAGYLFQVLNPAVNYGGRKLTDDVVDTSLGVIFGPIVKNDAIAQANCAANLCSDFTAQTGPQPTNTFPYLAAPNTP